MHKIKYILVLFFALIAVDAFFSIFFKHRQKPPADSVMSQTAHSALQHTYCDRQGFEGKSYIVCRANPHKDEIRLFLDDPAGKPYMSFRNVNEELAKGGETLAFAMNGGMYHADYSAVGLYVEGGREYHAVSTRDGPGNFHMKPNGIFYLAGNAAGVMETQRYIQSGIKPDYATQSGPMLVIENELHPRFIPSSPYLEYRNGVGVTSQGEAVFVISEQRVNFDELARFFRDTLKTPNALFLDGSISSLYAPQLQRADWFHPMGPIVGVIIPQDNIKPAQ